MAAASLKSPLALRFIFEAYCDQKQDGPASPLSTSSSASESSKGLMSEEAYSELIRDCPDLLDRRFTAADAKAALFAVALGRPFITFEGFVQALHGIAGLKYPEAEKLHFSYAKLLHMHVFKLNVRDKKRRQALAAAATARDSSGDSSRSVSTANSPSSSSVITAATTPAMMDSLYANTRRSSLASTVTAPGALGGSFGASSYHYPTSAAANAHANGAATSNSSTASNGMTAALGPAGRRSSVSSSLDGNGFAASSSAASSARGDGSIANLSRRGSQQLPSPPVSLAPNELRTPTAVTTSLAAPLPPLPSVPTTASDNNSHRHHHDHHPQQHSQATAPSSSAGTSTTAAPAAAEESTAETESETEAAMRTLAATNAEHAAAKSAEAAALQEELNTAKQQLKQYEDAYRSLSADLGSERQEMGALKEQLRELATRLQDNEQKHAHALANATAQAAAATAAAAASGSSGGDGAAVQRLQQQYQSLLKAEQDKVASASREAHDLRTRLASLQDQLGRALAGSGSFGAGAGGGSSSNNTLLSWDVSSTPKYASPAVILGNSGGGGRKGGRKGGAASSPFDLLCSLTKLAVFASFPFLLGLGAIHLEEALISSSSASPSPSLGLSLHLARAIDRAQDRHPLVASRLASFAFPSPSGSGFGGGKEKDGCLRLFNGKVTTPLCFSEAVLERLRTEGGDEGAASSSWKARPAVATPGAPAGLNLGSLPGTEEGETGQQAAAAAMVVLSEGLSKEEVDAASAAGQAAGAEVVWLLPKANVTASGSGNSQGTGGAGGLSFFDLPSSPSLSFGLNAQGEQQFQQYQQQSECDVCGMEFVAS